MHRVDAVVPHEPRDERPVAGAALPGRRREGRPPAVPAQRSSSTTTVCSAVEELLHERAADVPGAACDQDRHVSRVSRAVSGVRPVRPRGWRPRGRGRGSRGTTRRTTRCPRAAISGDAIRGRAAADVEQLARRAVGLRRCRTRSRHDRVRRCRARVSASSRIERSSPVPDVDVLVAVVVLHQEEARVGEVVDVQELTPRAAGPPHHDLVPRPRHLGVVELADQRREHVGTRSGRSCRSGRRGSSAWPR